MSELSPKERAFLEAVRKDWGPSAEVAAAVRDGIPARLREKPDFGSEGPGPGPEDPTGRFASAKVALRGPWGAGTGLVVVGLCVAGAVWLRGGSHDVSSPRTEPVATAQAVRLVTPAPSPSPPSVTPEAPPAETIPMEAVSLDSLPNAPAAPQARSASTATSTPSGDTLAEELALLRTAQNARRGGAPDEALAALATHASRFPHGVLREERMTLQVLTLCDRGDVAGARAVRDELARSAPGSSHLQRLATSCAAR